MCFLRHTTGNLSQVLTEVETQVRNLTIANRETHQRQLDTTHNRITELEGQLDSTRAAARQHTTDLARIRGERDRYRIELDAMTQKYQAQQLLLSGVTADRERLKNEKDKDKQLIDSLRISLRTESASVASLSTEMQRLVTEFQTLQVSEQDIATALKNTYKMLQRYRRAFPEFDEVASPDSSDTNILQQDPTHDGPIQAPPLPSEGFSSGFFETMDDTQFSPNAALQGQARTPESRSPSGPRPNSPVPYQPTESEEATLTFPRSVRAHPGAPAKGPSGL